MQFESRNTKMIASQYFFFANNNIDENTFILLRVSYLKICSMVLTKTNTMHAWLLKLVEDINS
jgi:hypothetical protein